MENRICPRCGGQIEYFETYCTPCVHRRLERRVDTALLHGEEIAQLRDAWMISPNSMRIAFKTAISQYSPSMSFEKLCQDVSRLAAAFALAEDPSALLAQLETN